MLAAKTVYTVSGIAPREKRYPCAELVDLSWAAEDSREHQEYAILAEVWTSGGVFLVDEPVRRGTRIHVSLPHGRLWATVLSCRKEKRYWAAEVEIEQTEEWFGGRYEPAILVLGEILTTPPRPGPRLVGATNPVAAMLRATFRRGSQPHTQPRAS